MKQAKRIIAFVMMILMVFTAVDWTGGANAEGLVKNEATQGTTDVSEAPEELHKLGEWSYWVEEGIAIIAGYDSMTESVLKIPEKLDGYPVSGIGSRAFSGHQSLRSVQIHTNVTQIAPDAFEGLQGLTICGYHGSYALVYAEAQGIASECLTDLEGVEFADNVLDLAGLSSDAYSDLCDVSVSFRTDEAAFLAPGQVLYFPKSEAYPTGLARRVVGVVQDGDSLTAILAQPEWAECFNRVVGEDDVYIDWANAEVYEGFELEDVVPNGSMEAGMEVGFNVNYKINSKLTLSGSQKIKFNAKVSYDIGWKWFLPHFNEVNVKVTKIETTSLKLSTKFQNNPGGADSGRIGKRITIATVPVASVAGAINGYMTLDMVLEVSGEFEVYSKVETNFNFNYKNGKTSSSKDKNVIDRSFKLQAEVKAGPELKVYFVFGWAGFSIRFFELSGGVFVKVTGSSEWIMLKAGTEKYHNCSNFSISVVIEAGVKIGLIKIVGKDLTAYGSINLKIPPLKLLEGHYDDCEYVGDSSKCTMKNRKVVFKADGKTYQETTANVNSTLTEPKKPIKTGYKFEGWYVNTKASGLTGSNYKFNFAKDYMPYCGKNGTLVLEAKYTKVEHPVTGIKLNQTNVTTYTNNKNGVQLKATVSPANADDPSVSWSSSDSKIASVNSKGKVTLHAPGTVTITCRSDSNHNIYATCKIVVKQYVEGVSLNGTVASMVVGDTESLSAQVTPANASDKSLAWTSSNTAAATVDANGKVRAVAPGSTTITATAKDGSGISGSYTILVVGEPAVPPTVPVTNVTADQTSMTLYTVNKEGVLINAAVTPSNADDLSLVWASSNPQAATVDADGRIRPVRGGKAIITGRSVTNPHVNVSINVTVIQSVESITVTADRTVIDIGEKAHLTAEVSPVIAANKNVSWSSSDTAVAKVDANGVVTGLAQGRVKITATAKDGSGVTGSCTIQVGQAVPILVGSITLDLTEINVYSNNKESFQLTATVLPRNADDLSVIWSSNNEKVASVTNEGLVTTGEAGTAIISCRSVSDPGVMGICTVTVKQYAEQLYIESSAGTLLPGETAQLTAEVYPENTSDKSVTWSSSNEAIASVDAAGKVTAHAPGTVTLSAKTNDGSEITEDFVLVVEKELQLDVSVSNATVYTQGSETCVIANVGLTRRSALYIAKSGLTPTWTLTRKSGSGDTALTELAITVSEGTNNYSSSVAMISGGQFPQAGTEVYTVTCRAGGYEESVDITLAVDGTEYASSVYLSDSPLGKDIFEAAVGDQIFLPAVPLGEDERPVPEEMLLEVSGDQYYQQTANEASENGTIAVSFDESGVYSAEVRYTAGNLKYTAEASFYIADENGIVHKRVSEITLSDSSLSILEGQTAALTASVAPEDAFNSAVEWTSSDGSVASVDQNGLVTAHKPGYASILCVSQEDGHISAMCTVAVEGYLQLDENELDYTVFRGGDDHATLGIINVTTESEQRLRQSGLNVSWSLERVSGSSAELGLGEYVGVGEDGLSVNGNLIRLLRMNTVGTDEYRLTCRAGSYSDSCNIRVTVAEANLPQAIELNKNAYESSIQEWITLDFGYSMTPAAASLPEDTEISIDGGNAFWNAVSGLYSFSEPEQMIFELPGTYQASLVFFGSNYRYVCPITFTIADEDGKVPVNITDVKLDQEQLMLAVGESRVLSLFVEPADAAYSSVEWTSTDTSVVTVSSDGRVTAIGAGVASVVVRIPETDEEGACLVLVEDGITFVDKQVERTVFVDGDTRMTLDTLMLTENTSLRLAEAPEWTLRRVSGNSLTLRASGYETINEKGDPIYGCEITLYSVSKEGDTVYELSCSNESESAAITITVHAVDRDRLLPASISIDQTVFTADINELIVLQPVITTYPEGSTLPEGIILSCEGGRQYQEALNAEDNYISQSISTFSFHKAGTYEARLVFSYSNMNYSIPVTFRIRNEQGEVPVQGYRLALSSSTLYMQTGEKADLEAIFTPANTTNRNVSWSSTDGSVATVDSNGKVSAVGIGEALIICTPEDPELTEVQCAVVVEDYMTVDTGTTSRTLFVQGEEENTVAFARLSQGTLARLKTAGLEPVWTLNADGVMHAALHAETTEDNSGVAVLTDRLISGGSDSYTLTCVAGEYRWSRQYTLNVIDLGSTAPTEVTIQKTEVSASVNQKLTIDFTPVVLPAGSAMPDGILDTGFVGVGEYYDALDFSVYKEDGNSVTLGFTKPGQYLLTRRYLLNNLSYVTACTITVGGEESGRHLLKATETEFTLYSGGRSGSVSTVSLTDANIWQFWGQELEWKADRISGNSMTVALKNNGDSVDVFVANVINNGTDVWRISCSFGGMTEFVDIRLTAADPRGPLPESLSLEKDCYSDTIGNWIYIPLGVACQPVGSMLPDQGDEFWSVSFDQAGEERSSHVIENNMLRVCFMVSGYYTASLRYHSGNVSYTIPIYFIIKDEEGEVHQENLNMYLVNLFETVYPEGETGISLGEIVIAESLSTYSTGAAVAYMSQVKANWELKQNGTAAKLSIQRVSPNVYQLMLDSVSSSGDVEYSVRCAVDGGKTYSVTYHIHVADENEPRPDATLLHSVYQTEVGETVNIDRRLYSRADGSVLQSSTHFDPSGLLAAIGYEVEENNDSWVMTFYESGVYEPHVSAFVSNIRFDTPLTIRVTQKGEAIELNTLKFPAELTEIKEEAFEGVSADVADLSGTKLKSIGARAFRHCIDLKQIILPGCVSFIADDAFYGCLNLVFVCEEGSYAAAWALSHGFQVEFP